MEYHRILWLSYHSCSRVSWVWFPSRDTASANYGKPLLVSGSLSLQWRHNERDCVSNHQHHGCLLNSLFRPRSKKTPKLRVTGRCVGNSPVTGEFTTQRASNTENVSIWWRHYGWSLRDDSPTGHVAQAAIDWGTKRVPTFSSLNATHMEIL